MNLWNKIVLGTKFLFGGFESATDYLLGRLNKYLAKEGVSGKIQKALAFVETILKYLKKYEKYCPAIWTNDYLKLLDILQKFVGVLDDGKVTADEIEKAVAVVNDAIDEWFK